VKVVLFCGGLGLRMREYSDRMPKPMVPIGESPILWHLMRYYAHFGHDDFVLCLGHQGDVIERWFLDNPGAAEGWNVTFADTGVHASIGERLTAVRHHLESEDRFLANYADGLSDVPLDEVIALHESGRAVATFVTVVPQVSFHLVDVAADNRVTNVRPAAATDLRINGGFFVFDRTIFDHIEPGDELVAEPFDRLMKSSLLYAYPHDGFWASMDTYKDRQTLDDWCRSGHAPWQVWEPDR
jgi:glucose-1-phosphate cytidylyltransferase